MTTITAKNIRKAAVLVRSLDADTAATLLAQLSSAEAAAIRETMRSLGPLDPEEQADVAAELRRAKPIAAEAAHGVELRFSSTAAARNAEETSGPDQSAKRFAFLDDASPETLAIYLAREHAQTIAVVASHLAPTRAAAVLAVLPAKLQAETFERLAVLGDMDPESLSALERELHDWVARQPKNQRRAARSSDVVEGILAAADATMRQRILANLATHNERLANHLAPKWTSPLAKQPRTQLPEIRTMKAIAPDQRAMPLRPSPEAAATSNSRKRHSPTRASSAPPFRFEDLAELSATELAAVLGDVDATVLVLALAGSNDMLVDRVTEQMPKRIARTFRRQLRQLGPTRLSDVEAAQRAVAETAGRRFQRRRTAATSAA